MAQPPSNPPAKETEVMLPATTGAVEPAGRGLYKSVPELTAAFQKAPDQCNFLAPIRRIDFIPPLHAVSLRVVSVNHDPSRGECFKVDGGKFALTKVSLDKIAAAAGISWYPTLCGRMDDGSDGNYCHFRAAGWLIDLDGQKRDISGERVIDLRDGSSTAKGMQPRELEQARKFLLALAESKAKNRAIRAAVAIKSGYTPDELKRPFILPKLIFTGESDDPAIQRIVAEKIAERAIGASALMYGGTAAPPEPPALPAPPAVPPPVTSTPRPEEGGGDDSECAVCHAGEGEKHMDGCPNGEPSGSSPQGELEI